jgi:hypothetical protein
MLLNNRVQRLVIPQLDYLPYVRNRRLLAGRRFEPLTSTGQPS